MSPNKPWPCVEQNRMLSVSLSAEASSSRKVENTHARTHIGTHSKSAVNILDEEIDQWLRTATVLAKNLGSVSRTQNRKLTASCDSSSKGYAAL